MKHFANIENLNDLKKAFRKLAFEHHPDRGGNADTMAEINAEYEKLYAILAAQAENEQAEKRGETGTATPDDFKGDDGYRAVIEALLAVEGIEIELCGAWLWISGTTREHKDTIKAAGCYWAAKKKMWYWRPPEKAARHNRHSYSMEYIRDKYGSTSISKKKDDEKKKIKAA